MTDDRPPAGYTEPAIVWAVEYADEREPGAWFQFGAFTTEEQALLLAERKRADGWWSAVRINMLAVHRRVEDWEWDR